MGYVSAVGMAEVADIDSALDWHLRWNHFPALPTALAPICKAALRAANDGEWETVIDLQGFQNQGRRAIPAWEIVESLHLEAWLESDVEAEADANEREGLRA